MRRFFILFSIISVLSLLQGILRGFIAVNGFSLVPDFSLVFLVLFSIEFGRGVGQSAGWLGGILEDFAMVKPLGLSALTKMLIGTIFGALKGQFTVGSIIVALITVFFATILKYFLAWFVSKLFSLEVFSLLEMLPNLLVEIGLNILITTPIFWSMKKILKGVADFIRREQKV